MTTPKGAQGTIWCYVHTDPRPFLPYIPKNECLIAPIVDYHLSSGAQTNSGWFIIKVPHCQKLNHSSVKVRHGNVYERSAGHFRTLDQYQTEADGFAAPGSLSAFFTVHSHYILICTKTFSQFICTSCDLVCQGQGQAFVFGKMLKDTAAGSVTSLRLYTCSPLHVIKDYREVNLVATILYCSDVPVLVRFFCGLWSHHFMVKKEKETFLLLDRNYTRMKPIMEGTHWNRLASSGIQSSAKRPIIFVSVCNLLTGSQENPSTSGSNGFPTPENWCT